jgi:hypothetical protein
MNKPIGLFKVKKHFPAIRTGNPCVQSNRIILLEILREKSLNPYLGNIIIS